MSKKMYITNLDIEHETELADEFSKQYNDEVQDLVRDSIINYLTARYSSQAELEAAAYSLNTLSRVIFQKNVDAGWWTDLASGEDLRGYKEGPQIPSNAKRDVLNLLMLVVTEVAEMAEGVRKNLPDDKLPHRSMFSVEAADVMIRLFDICGAHNIDLGGALLEKLEYNKNREDHKPENRRKENGKKT